MDDYQDRWWMSGDGLRLHYRDYPGNSDHHPPILCLPGLTRNARDFAALATRLSSPAGGSWRVLCAEMRGRGLSAYASDPTSYTPYQYVADVIALLDAEKIEHVVIIGTSLGGLMAMVMAMEYPQRIAACLLNDVGPVLSADGLGRIGAYVGANPRFAGWDAALAYQKNLFGQSFPQRSDTSWLASAKRLMVQDDDGSIRFDYDPSIAAPFRTHGGTALPDLWPGLETLGRWPLLLIRGALSDILTADVFAEMARRAPQADTAVVSKVGHTPALDEPEAERAITRWLAQLAAQAKAQGGKG